MYKIFRQSTFLLTLFVVKVTSVYAIYNGTPVPNSDDYPFMVSVQLKNT